MGHIRETGTQLIDIGTDQWIRRKERYMILDEHQTARMKRRVDATGSIGKEKNFRTHHLHQTGGQHHIRDRIALIVMHPSLHQNHRDLIDITEDKLAGMSRNGRYGESLDLAVGELCFHIHYLGKIAET